MIDLANGIDSLTNFKRRTPYFLKQLRKSGKPVVLTINGKAEVIVQDVASYQKSWKSSTDWRRSRRSGKGLRR